MALSSPDEGAVCPEKHVGFRAPGAASLLLQPHHGCFQQDRAPSRCNCSWVKQQEPAASHRCLPPEEKGFKVRVITESVAVIEETTSS